MKVRYTWYKRRSETRFYLSRIIVSRLIALGWIAALVVFYAVLAYIIDMDNAENAEGHFTKAAWLALIVIFSAGLNHLLMAAFGELLERYDERERPPRN